MTNQPAEDIIEKLREMTLCLGQDRRFINTVPASDNLKLEAALIDYSVALSFLATKTHELSRKIYIAKMIDRPIKPASQLASIADQLSARGVTLDMIKDFLEKKKESQNGPS